MYSRQETSQLKKEFWTIFGQYMNPILSSEGEKINWVNYKTGEKDIFFRMEAGNKTARIGIELKHKDEVIRQIYFEQFSQSKNSLHQTLNEEWSWHLHDADDHGKEMSRIYKSVEGLSILNKEDWPALISFFKPRMIALDEFWNSVKYGFEMLR